MNREAFPIIFITINGLLLLQVFIPTFAAYPSQSFSTTTTYTAASTVTSISVWTNSQQNPQPGSPGWSWPSTGNPTAGSSPAGGLDFLFNGQLGIWPQVILSAAVGWFLYAALKNGTRFLVYVAGLIVILWALYGNPMPNMLGVLLPVGSDIASGLIKLIQSQGYLTITAFAIGFIASWQTPTLRDQAARKLI